MNSQLRVLRPMSPDAESMKRLRQQDRKNLFSAILLTLLIHGLVVLVLLLTDLWRLRDLGDWSGPVLVKIGVSDGIESPLPDSEPEQPSQPLDEQIDTEPVLEPVPDAAPETPAPTPQAENVVQAEEGSAPSSTAPAEPLPPLPSRVQGSENGASYLMDFDGSEKEVGRAGAYEYISSYLPLPEVLDGAMVNSAVEYLKMSPDFIRGEILRYWEPVFGDYAKKPGTAVPPADRPYYWSLLIHSLGFDMADADWRRSNFRPVTVEFTVSPSRGALGAELSNFRIVSRTNDPRYDEAVAYGLSRWVYYNNTEHPVKGRITYEFDR